MSEGKLSLLGRWTRQLSARVAMLSWDESKRTRGKTTPKSRGGSFAPKDGGATRRQKEADAEKNYLDKLKRQGVIKDYTGDWTEDTRPESWYWMKSQYPLSLSLVDKLNTTGKFASTGSRSARRLRGAIDKWVTGGSVGNEQMSDASSRGMVSYALSISKSGRAPELFRGVADDKYAKVYSKLKVGGAISIPPTSWSASREVAEEFSEPMRGGQSKKRILFQLLNGRALNVQNYAGNYKDQMEWVAGGGQFKVIKKAVGKNGMIFSLREVK
mgnify:FL=1